LDRHLKSAREWFPHEYVPWSDGRNFDGVLGGDAWDPSQSRVSEVARTALVVNLLTEDNLPSYHRDIYESFGTDGAWGTWIGRWTAEEGRHGIAIRDYLLTTRAVDPVTLERERMVHMTQGFASLYDLDMLHTVAYVSFQELATRISHRNTGRYTEDPVCEQLLARIAQDENLHMVFYRNVLQAALELAPDETMRAICDVVSTFQMPGNTIEGFTRRSVQIAMASIYDLRIHRDECAERFEGSGPQLDSAAACRPIRRTARGFSLLGEALTNALTQLAGTELSSRTDFRNRVAGTASKAPRVPRRYAQKISETKATVALMPTASPVNRG
jgi:acyl-[acyl-carrier-protein] desaturase